MAVDPTSSRCGSGSLTCTAHGSTSTRMRRRLVGDLADGGFGHRGRINSGVYACHTLAEELIMTNAEIDKMVAQTNDLMSRVNIQPRKQTVAPPPPPRFPYHHHDLNETISSQAEERTVNAVLAMGYEELQLLNDEIKTRRALDPTYSSTREYVLRCKAGIWRAHLLKKAGKFGPAPSMMEAAASFMGGWILADEFWKRNGF